MNPSKRPPVLDECHLGRKDVLENSKLTFENPPVLYMTILSPPVRSVLMVAAALDIPLKTVNINLMKGEHMTPEYMKKNPQHTIPLLDDNGFYLWDSHAISSYLVTVYGKNDNLYPKEPRLRATIDQRMYFNSSILFPSLRAIVAPLLKQISNTIAQERKDEAHSALAFLEKFLEGREWLAGDDVTLADICTVTTVSSLNELLPLQPEKYPNIIKWWKLCEKLPYYQEQNTAGVKGFGEFIRSLIKE